MGRNVNVRTVMAELPSQGAAWTGPDAEEAVRVLLVFADEHNLAMRREREALRQVFHEVMPHRLVSATDRALGRLPDVFTAGLDDEEKERERQYLEDVAVGSVDLLLRRSTYT